MADYEMLELLLTYPIPRRDTKKLSKELINHFGSFAAVLDQPRKRLLEIKGIGPETATFLLAIRASMVRYFEQHAELSDTISTPEDIAKFVKLHIGANQRECLLLLCLNDANKLMHHEIVIEGTVDRAPFYPREIMKSALDHNATKIIMVHNHPSGEPAPSENDHRITAQLEKIAAEFSIKLLDHLIATPRQVFCLKTGRLL
ncbi:MAG: DNA repair protein RadC [Proteobacteria bacterium]|nr:DNA repair protein RadC [Pseudomonadota bacterium]MBU4297282.1 DNA repair protein RadC [Pseudomonadota bacterium]